MADSEPIGSEAPVHLTSIADTTVRAIPKAPKVIYVSTGKTIRQTIVSTAIAGSRIVSVSAYSSTPEETDDSPFITALGTTVRDGIVATNFLPFGTKIRIPSIFGDKVFVVEDRMSTRFNNHLDIWMPSKSLALQFGRTNASIEIID